MTWPIDWPKLDPELERACQGRLFRWRLRRELVEAGAPVLTLDQLENLIIRTQLAAMTASDPMIVATHLLRLDDMERTFDWHAFAGDAVTGWPDVPSWR